MALAKEWKERKHCATAQIRVLPYPARPALLWFKSKKYRKGPQARSSVGSWGFDQLVWESAALTGTRGYSRGLRGYGGMKELPTSDQHYPTSTTPSNTTSGISSSLCSDVSTPLHYTSTDKTTITRVSQSLQAYVLESSPLFPFSPKAAIIILRCSLPHC